MQRLESSSGSSGRTGSINQSQEERPSAQDGGQSGPSNNNSLTVHQTSSTLMVPVASTAIRASLAETRASQSAGSSEGSGSDPAGSSKKNRFLLRRQDCLEKGEGPVDVTRLVSCLNLAPRSPPSKKGHARSPQILDFFTPSPLLSPL